MLHSGSIYIHHLDKSTATYTVYFKCPLITLLVIDSGITFTFYSELFNAFLHIWCTFDIDFKLKRNIISQNARLYKCMLHNYMYSALNLCL